MRKRPFLTFSLIISALVLGVVLFIQSAQFALVLKSMLVRYVPADLGVQVDFEALSVKLFPPGVSINQPKIVLSRSKRANLPAGSSIQAQRIDLEFLPLQALSGSVRVNRVVVVGGDIRVHLDKEFLGKLEKGKKAEKKGPLSVRWDELFQVRAKAIAL